MDTITEEDVDEVSVISKGSSHLLMQQQPPHNSPLNMSIKAPKDVPHLALVQEEEVTIDGEEEEEGVTEEREDKKKKGVDVDADADANGKIIVEDVTEEELKPSITSTTSATSTTTPPTSPPPATPPQLPPKKASPLANINNNQLNPANSPRAVIDQMNLMTFLKQTTQNKMVLEFDSSKPEFTDADSVLSFDDSRPGTATKSPSSSRPDTGTSYQQPPPPSSQLEKEAISAALNGMSMDDLLSLSSKGDQTVPITNTNSFYNSNYSSDGTTNDNESGVTPTSNTMSPTRHHPNQIPHPHSSTASLPPRLQSVSPKRRRSFFDPSNPTQSQQQQQQQYQQHQDPSSSPSPRLSPPPPPEIYKRQPHLSVEEYIKSLALAEAAAKSGASEFTTESKLVILDKLELNAKIQRNLKRQERRKKYERFFSNSRSYFVDAIAGLKETAKTIDANMEKKRLEYVEKKKVEKEWEDLSIGKSFSDDLSVDEEQKVEEKDEGKEEEKEKLKSSMTSKAKQEQKEEQQRVEEDPSSEPLDEILLNEVVVDDNVVLSTSTKEVKHDTATSIQELTKELQQPESQPQDNNDDNDDDNNDDDNTKELNMVMEVVPSSEKKDVLKETTIQSQ